MKQFDAETFNKQPAKAYRAADLGEEVYITHSHYPDKVFVLTAQDADLKWQPVQDLNPITYSTDIKKPGINTTYHPDYVPLPTKDNDDE